MPDSESAPRVRYVVLWCSSCGWSWDAAVVDDGDVESCPECCFESPAIERGLDDI